ncbi:protein of unknown function [Georgfuchsia toluolica]|uniref:Transcriptional regulator-like domain-containing protein n=1 Tax=Georgfuchsia toluolica TaxID=424218 RepID=A0A916N9E1_9PROT|nr:DUF6499 domain-containing protein [Georgfuchsia toluolica]CAG4883810.1 protein of unknown function [Georgfuchsia toluolica]
MAKSKQFPQDYPRPDWLPNWEDKTEYKNHGDDLEAWAWECLRRNPEYQAEYVRWARLPDTVIAEDGKSVLSAKIHGSACDLLPMAFCHGDPPAINADETVSEYESRTGESAETLRNYICRKWGMLDPQDPAECDPPDWDTAGDVSREMPPYSIPFCEELIVISGFKQGFEDHEGRLLHAWWPREYDAYVRTWAFDLRNDINDQIDLLREILKEEKKRLECGENDRGLPTFDPMKRVTRPNGRGRSTLLDDLRILDAKWSGASGGEIIASLWGVPNKSPYPDENCKAMWHAAKEQKIKEAMQRITWRIIDEGWRELVRWSSLPQSKKNMNKKKNT